MLVQGDIGLVVKVDQGRADALAYGTAWRRGVSVDFCCFAFGGGLTDAVQSDLLGGVGEHPASAAGGFGGYEVMAAETGEETADDDGVGADAGGDELRGEALARFSGSEEAQDVNC